MFRLVLFVLLGLATFKLALADPDVEQKQTVTQLPLMVNCIPNDAFFKMIDEYGEQPFSDGLSSWSIPGGRDANGRTVIYVNPNTFTFTVAIDFVDVKCVVFSGREFAPLLSDKNST